MASLLLRLPQRGLYFGCCKAGFPQPHFKGNKRSCKPCKLTTGSPASHNEMTLHCYWGWGLHWSQMGCLIYKSFLCEPISHWGSTGEKSLSNCACVFGESIHSRNTRPNLHWLTPLWKNTPLGLHYLWSEPANSAKSKHIVFYWCDQYVKAATNAGLAPFNGFKMHPVEYTKNRLSPRTILRRLYSTFVTSSQNKAI